MPLRFAAICAFACAAFAQTRGPAATPDLHPTDIYSHYSLPALQDGPGAPLAAALAALQVGMRAQTLGLSSTSATAAWRAAQTLLERPALVPGPPAPQNSIVFSGTTASALNQVISSSGADRIQVTAANLTIDQPIEIRRSNLALDLANTQLVSATSQHYMLRIEYALNITVIGGSFVSGDSGILVYNAANVLISTTQMNGLTGAGIVISGSTRVEVANTSLTGMGLAGIMLHRGVTQSIVADNQITAGNGFSNMMAGVVVTDREVDLSSDPRAILSSDGYWVITQPITERLNPPHDNLILGNTVSDGLASGIYLDGAVRTVIYSNTLRGNSKEGLCLDNGSTANVVAANIVSDNGDRWGDPDSILALDSILAGGRLPDGTAAEKVPGISLDNAIYNIVVANNVVHNYGGGVKIVRTGYFNAIGLNTLADDNDGAGPVFHFFGIELGAASGSSPELDFTPSHGNIVFSNLIRGSHYSGIFFDPGSDNNNVLFNVILDASAWALESATPMTNSSVDNLTPLPSRNVGSGLDPALVTSGQPVFDPPQ
jgi:parallel beta-helix repeat protein